MKTTRPRPAQFAPFRMAGEGNPVGLDVSPSSILSLYEAAMVYSGHPPWGVDAVLPSSLRGEVGDWFRHKPFADARAVHKTLVQLIDAGDIPAKTIGQTGTADLLGTKVPAGIAFGALMAARNERPWFIESPQETPGRPPDFDWAAFDLELLRRLCHHGVPRKDDSEWKSQAAVSAAMADWCSAMWGADNVPGKETIRPKIKAGIQRYINGERLLETKNR